MNSKIRNVVLILFLLTALVFSGCINKTNENNQNNQNLDNTQKTENNPLKNNEKNNEKLNPPAPPE